MSLVWDLDLSAGDKLVLLALADQANDEGVQCWPSIPTIAKRSGQGERTVRRCISDLEAKGHLTRHFRDGTSTQYHIHPGQNGSPAKSAPLPKTTRTPAKLAGKTPRTTKLPSEAKASSGKRASIPAHPMPANWEPQEFSIGSVCRGIVDGWPPGEIEHQLEHFRAHHSKKADQFSSWQDAWKTWTLNSRNFRNGRSNFQRSEPMGLGRTARAAIEVFGHPDDDPGVDAGVSRSVSH